ncbi:MAG: cation diffusion facilitator family transporter [Lachnospiraceae bacterium]|nr:cation diffusion facilitator family transporter [Lachnospiraceae bacterium]
MKSVKEQKKSIGVEDSREKIIIRTSIIGIVANVLLALFKAVIGILSNSIAIVLDAVNNVSDAGSSLVTIIGTKLASREPDKKHPFGYGRLEYLSAMVIAVIVMYAGLTSFGESIERIIEPKTPNYSIPSLVIVAVAVFVKVFLGRYVKRVGEKVNSDSLMNSGEDALMDSVISASTLVAAIIYLFFHISLEAWLGAIISITIIKAGYEMLRDTISRLLGESNDIELARAIKDTVLEFPQVKGAYDLVLNNYGPNAWNGSIHIEIPDTCMAHEIDKLIRDIQEEVYYRHKVILTAVGIYSVNTQDEEVISTRQRVNEIVFAYPNVRQIHGFYIEKEKSSMRFDLVISFDAMDRKALYEDIMNDLEKAFPDYSFRVALDTDFAES